jgi:2-methylisocitrate lyase-like PEP mutase family enzyme
LVGTALSARGVHQDHDEEEAMNTQTEKAEIFRKLHAKGSCFVIPNPWDQGSARILEHMGFKALASSSAGFAFSIAKQDLAITKASLMAHLTGVCQATSVPLSADLQNGFGNDPEDAAVTILQAAKTGIVGGSIEDSSGDSGSPIYPLEFAAERIRQAAVAAIDRPLNVLIGMPGMHLTVPQLQDLGVTRISLGGSLARAAYGAMMRAATEILTKGSFDYTAQAAARAQLEGIFAPPGA